MEELNKRLEESSSSGPMQAYIADELLFRHWTDYKGEKESYLVLFDTKEIDKGFRMKVGTDKYEGGSLDDAFTMMHVGDSARFLIDAVLFFTNTRKEKFFNFIIK